MKFLSVSKRLFACVLIACLIVTTIYSPEAKAAEPDWSRHRAVYTIVIDPGHGQKGGTDCGAIGNGLYERDVNLKIALYLKDELKKYDNVRVYMTREKQASPFYEMDGIGTYAASVNADLLISIHNNAGPSNAAGCMVCVPNDHYDKNCYAVGNGVAAKIVNNLAALGLKKNVLNGLYPRLTESGSKYPDGSLSDYYSIIRQGKENHVPAIIVEHAYITNADDCKKFLSNEAGLKKLAQADAKGLAEYFNFERNKSFIPTISRNVDYSAVYDHDYYVNKYSDVKKAYGNNKVGAFFHFLQYGMKEGRQASANFNPEIYKNNYADLKRNFGTNNVRYYQHYVSNGAAEKRVADKVVQNGATNNQNQNSNPPKITNPTTVYNGKNYSAIYDFNYYIEKYADIKRNFANNDAGALRHFVEYGINENRIAKAGTTPAGNKAFVQNLNGNPKNPTTVYNGTDYSAVYDFNYYINKYSDMKRLFSSDPNGALKHFVTCGMKEGRQASANFDVRIYRLNNSDLSRIFGANKALYYIHYVQYGKKEGRAATGTPNMTGATTVYNGVDYRSVYDFNYYVNKYADIKRAFGQFDENGVLKHFVTYGLKENRQAKASYDKNEYAKLRTNAINAANANGKTPIMGTSTVTKAQMVKYYNKVATYPQYYKNTDAPTIDAFVQIYIEECAAEGVRADIAFAQAMDETGYLRFGGLVHIEDLNFAGMGATDSSNDRKIAEFTSVRMGVRAQIQHLKAYACTDAIKNEIVDPRFELVTRGSAPYVEYLSIPNNPYGKGWASNPTYATDILRIVSNMKAQ